VYSSRAVTQMLAVHNRYFHNDASWFQMFIKYHQHVLFTPEPGDVMHGAIASQTGGTRYSSSVRINYSCRQSATAPKVGSGNSEQPFYFRSRSAFSIPSCTRLDHFHAPKTMFTRTVFSASPCRVFASWLDCLCPVHFIIRAAG